MAAGRICLVLCAVAAATAAPTDTSYDTIVIGLGSAGTTAASTLAKAGRKVLALDAQGHIGGRVKTVPFGDGIVEYGAEWIHGQFPSRVYLTAVEHNITILPQDVDYKIINSRGQDQGEALMELVKTGYMYAFGYLGEIDTIDKDQPVGEYVTAKLTEYAREKFPEILNETKLFERVLHAVELDVCSMEAATSWNDVNAKSEYEELGGNQEMSWHRLGYKTFFELLLNTYKGGPGLPTLDIKLNTEVTQVQWSTDPAKKVTVVTKDGAKYTADNVIVTVSLGVLKERYKDLFSPPLPESKVTAIEKLVIGVTGKIILSFKAAWWPKMEWLNFFWMPEDVETVSEEDKWTTEVGEASYPMGSSNTLTLWTSGNTSKHIETLSDEVVKTKSMELLRRFFGRNTTVPEPTGILVSRWFSNPFTRGTYTYDSIRAAAHPTARSDLAAPLVDSAGGLRVLFAGEATHEHRFGTVHGAADSGYREAMRLLNGRT